MSFRAVYSSPLLRMPLGVSCRGSAAIIKFARLLREDHFEFQIPCFKFISKFLQYFEIGAIWLRLFCRRLTVTQQYYESRTEKK